MILLCFEPWDSASIAQGMIKYWFMENEYSEHKGIADTLYPKDTRPRWNHVSQYSITIPCEYLSKS